MRKTIVLMIIMMMVAGFALYAQEQQTLPADTPAFMVQLATNLRQRGWSEEDVAQIMIQARLMNWEEVERADPEMVGYALSYGYQRSETADPELARTRAQLAYELAFSVMEMERYGYDSQTIAMAAANGARDALAQIREWKDNGSAENLGQLIRNTVRESVRQETALRSNAKERQQMSQSQNAVGIGAGGSIGIGNPGIGTGGGRPGTGIGGGGFGSGK